MSEKYRNRSSLKFVLLNGIQFHKSPVLFDKNISAFYPKKLTWTNSLDLNWKLQRHHRNRKNAVLPAILFTSWKHRIGTPPFFQLLIFVHKQSICTQAAYI